jgi:hypothetical protein
MIRMQGRKFSAPAFLPIIRPPDKYMAVFLFSTKNNTDHNEAALKVLLKSDSIFSFEIDKERKLLTVITTGNIKPKQIQEWLKEEGYECSHIK